MSNLSYRADIDGLRSIAVSAVIAYHLGISVFSGGYVGVDIFFVISGFLIGNILIGHLKTDTLSFSDFYLRRAKRLFPAFFTVVACTLTVGYFLMLPWDYQQLAQSALASSVYLSNVHFYTESGYFDTSSELKPLLHTWSLAVEEQFYLFFPIIFLGIFKYFKQWKAILIGIATISFVSTLYYLEVDQPAAFFLFPFRAWELLMGVILAAGVVPQTNKLWLKNILGVLSLLLMLLPVFTYTHDTQFPGITALFPCVGAALYIYLGTSGQLPLSNRIFSFKPFVLIGLASYSLYLWHWPIIVFARYTFTFDSGVVSTTVVAIILFAVGFLSWRYIERPSKEFLDKLKPVQIALSSTIISITLVTVSLFFHRTEGFPERLPEAVVKLADAGMDFSHDWSRCYKEDQLLTPGMSACIMGNEKLVDTSPSHFTEVIWGDSHARAMMPGINAAASSLGVNALLFWEAGCPPVFDILKDEERVNAARDTQCTRRLEMMKAFFLNPDFKNITKVILISRWAYYVYGQGIGIDKNIRVSIKSQDGSGLVSTTQSELVFEGLRKTIDFIRSTGRDVIIYEQVPEFPNFKPREIAIKTLLGDAKPDSDRNYISQEELAERQGNIDNFFRELAQEKRITFVDTHHEFCTETRCSALFEGVPRYIDNNHITVSASKKLSPLFIPVLSN